MQTDVNGDLRHLEAIKLEYAFLSAHVNALVIVRFTYFGTYLVAFGWLAEKSFSLMSLSAALAVTIVVWLLELRNRVIIRACTRRLVHIEQQEFGYEGFFRLNHRFQEYGCLNPDDRRTTVGVDEPAVFLLWKLRIPNWVDFSATMDAFFNFAVLGIIALISVAVWAPHQLSHWVLPLN